VSVPKEHIIPPGGFHFMEGEHRIESHSYQALADAVLQYRINNKLPVGNPLREVFDYVCNNHPHFCTSPTLPNQGSKQTLASRVATWMAQLYQSSRSILIEFAFVEQGEADRRAAICAKCPLNEDWRQGCGSCRESTKQIGFTFRAGRKSKDEGGLMACSVTGQENATAVWLKAPPSLSPETHNQLPEHCWRR
jgi:hypothetical protein